jgi:hypothetical protein
MLRFIEGQQDPAPAAGKPANRKTGKPENLY